MAKTRMLNTKFWNDSFISKLDPIEKLLFIYFISNEHTNICGIYELPLKICAIETGIDESMFKKIMIRLKPKIYYHNGWVFAINFPKHQSMGNPKIQKGVENEMRLIPKDILEKAIGYGYPIYRASHLDSDLDSDLDNNKPEVETEKFSKQGAELIKAFEIINPACKKHYNIPIQRQSCENLISTYGFERVKNVIENTLPKTNKISYMPTITTPLQLFEKWSSLEAGIIKLRSKSETQKSGQAIW